MTDDTTTTPDGAQSNALSDDQLAEVVGGMMGTFNVIAIGFKCCVADSSHVYALHFNASPICGCKEYTYE